MKVQLLTHTPNPERVVAQAGKLCYSSVGVEELNNKMTDEEVQKFVNMLVRIGHHSPLEHATFTFAIEGISRTCTHQLVRHRLASFSQQSQRYVKLDQFEYIVPPAIEKSKYAKKVFIDSMKSSQEAYDTIVDELVTRYLWEEYPVAMNSILEDISAGKYPEGVLEEDVFRISENTKSKYGAIEKKAIEDARYVFPNACETKIVMTMNLRELHHFFTVRCCDRAQWEIRNVATEMLKQCKQCSPILFNNCGPTCVRGACGEGKMSCGKPRTNKDFESEEK